MYNVRTPNAHFFRRSGISTSPSLLRSLHWCWFWLHSVKQRKCWEETGVGSGFRVFVGGRSLAPTWCWCCGWAHTGRCCCWCWDWGCGGSCWAWARTSGCSYRWGNRAEVRCLRTLGCRLAERRTASSGHGHPDSSHPHRTARGGIRFYTFRKFQRNLQEFISIYYANK